MDGLIDSEEGRFAKVKVLVYFFLFSFFTHFHSHGPRTVQVWDYVGILVQELHAPVHVEVEQAVHAAVLLVEALEVAAVVAQRRRQVRRGRVEVKKARSTSLHTSDRDPRFEKAVSQLRHRSSVF